MEPWLADAGVFSAVMWVAHNAAFVGWAWPCEWLYARNYFAQWKVQPAQYPDAKLVKRATRDLLLAKCLLEPIIWGLLYHFVWRAAAGPLWDPMPGFFVASVQITASFYGFFALNALVHREMHRRPSLYKFHKWHHEFKVTTGVASEHFDPFMVDLLANMVPTLLPALLLGMHPLLLAVHMLLRSWESVDTHTGYAFPFSPFQYLPGFADQQRYHAYHHHANRGTYSCLLFDHLLTGEAAPYLAFRRASFWKIATYGLVDNKRT